MSRAEPTSISTRLTAPPPARKNRRRIAPDTSTTSPARHDATVRRLRPLQTAQSRASTVARAAEGGSLRGTTTRNVHSGSPLGSVRSSGSWDSRPTNLTSFRPSPAPGTALCARDPVDAFDVFDAFVRADMHLTSAAHARGSRRQNRLWTRCPVDEGRLGPAVDEKWV